MRRTLWDNSSRWTLSLPIFLFGATCSWRIGRRVLNPIFLAHVKYIFSDQKLETHNPSAYIDLLQ